MRKLECQSCSTRPVGAVCDLSLDGLGELRAIGVTSVYRARQSVFTEGVPATGLYLVCEGQVKLFHADHLGREHILGIAGPGAVLGELSPTNGAAHSVSAEAMAESQLCFLARERLGGFLQRHPQASLRLIVALSKELGAVRRKARDLALKGAESRLASWLLELAQAAGNPSQGQRVEIPYSRREMADMIGVSTETAIRLLGKLRDRGAIAIERRWVILKDVDKLARLGHRDDMEGWSGPTEAPAPRGLSGNGAASSPQFEQRSLAG